MTGSASLAGTNGFQVPTFRGQPATTFTGWENFTVATNNGVGNAGDMAGSSTLAHLIQKEPNAAVLGSGNLYNQDHLSDFEIAYSSLSPVGRIVLHTRSAGNELDYGSMELHVGNLTLGATRTELDRTTFGGPPGTPGSGAFVASRWDWDVSGTGATSFTIDFKAADVSVSFDSATLDVQSVPEPGTLALCGLGALALGLRKRKQ